MPYVEDTHMFKMSVDDAKLGLLGPGFPMFLIFMKYLFYYMLCLCITYFLPLIGMILSALDGYEEWLDEKKEALLPLISYGAFIHRLDDPEIMQYTEPEKRILFQ